MRIIKVLIDKDIRGNFNLPGNIYCTKYEFGLKIAKDNNLNSNLLVPTFINIVDTKLPKTLLIKSNIFKKIDFKLVKDKKLKKVFTDHKMNI